MTIASNRKRATAVVCDGRTYILPHNTELVGYLDYWFPFWRLEVLDLLQDGQDLEDIGKWTVERFLLIIRLIDHCQLGDR